MLLLLCNVLLSEKDTLKDTSVDFGGQNNLLNTLTDTKSLILTPNRHDDHPRPLPTGVPPLSNPRVLPLFEELGPKMWGDSQKVGLMGRSQVPK